MRINLVRVDPGKKQKRKAPVKKVNKKRIMKSQAKNTGGHREGLRSKLPDGDIHTEELDQTFPGRETS
jgi:hypothetical protein